MSSGVVVASVCLTLVVVLAMLITAVVAYLLWNGAVWWLDNQARQAGHLHAEEDGRWTQPGHQEHTQQHQQQQQQQQQYLQQQGAGSLLSAPNQQQGHFQGQPENAQQQAHQLQPQYHQQQQQQQQRLQSSQLPLASQDRSGQGSLPKSYHHSTAQQQQQQQRQQQYQQHHQQYQGQTSGSPSKNTFNNSSFSLAEMTPERLGDARAGAGARGGRGLELLKKHSSTSSAPDFQDGDRCVEVQMMTSSSSAEDLEMLEMQDRSSTAGPIRFTSFGTDEKHRTQARQPTGSGADTSEATTTRNYTAQEVQRGYAAQLSMKFGGDQFFHIDNVDVVADIFNLSKDDLGYCALCLEEVGNCEGGAALRLKKWGTGSFSARVWTMALARFVKSAQKTRGAKDVGKVTRSCEQWQYRPEHFQRELETCEAIFQRKFGTALLFAFKDNSIREGELQRALQSLGESGRSTAPRRSRLALPSSSAPTSTDATAVATKESRAGRVSAASSSSLRPTLEDQPPEDAIVPSRLRKRTSNASNAGANAVENTGAEVKRRRQSRN